MGEFRAFQEDVELFNGKLQQLATIDNNLISMLGKELNYVEKLEEVVKRIRKNMDELKGSLHSVVEKPDKHHFERFKDKYVQFLKFYRKLLQVKEAMDTLHSRGVVRGAKVSIPLYDTLDKEIKRIELDIQEAHTNAFGSNFPLSKNVSHIKEVSDHQIVDVVDKIIEQVIKERNPTIFQRFAKMFR